MNARLEEPGTAHLLLLTILCRVPEALSASSVSSSSVPLRLSEFAVLAVLDAPFTHEYFVHGLSEEMRDALRARAVEAAAPLIQSLRSSIGPDAWLKSHVVRFAADAHTLRSQTHTNSHTLSTSVLSALSTAYATHAAVCVRVLHSVCEAFGSGPIDEVAALDCIVEAVQSCVCDAMLNVHRDDDIYLCNQWRELFSLCVELCRRSPRALRASLELWHRLFDVCAGTESSVCTRCVSHNVYAQLVQCCVNCSAYSLAHVDADVDEEWEELRSDVRDLVRALARSHAQTEMHAEVSFTEHCLQCTLQCALQWKQNPADLWPSLEAWLHLLTALSRPLCRLLLYPSQTENSALLALTELFDVCTTTLTECCVRPVVRSLTLLMGLLAPALATHAYERTLYACWSFVLRVTCLKEDGDPSAAFGAGIRFGEHVALRAKQDHVASVSVAKLAAGESGERLAHMSHTALTECVYTSHAAGDVASFSFAYSALSALDRAPDGPLHDSCPLRALYVHSFFTLCSVHTLSMKSSAVMFTALCELMCITGTVSGHRAALWVSAQLLSPLMIACAVHVDGHTGTGEASLVSVVMAALQEGAMGVCDEQAIECTMQLSTRVQSSHALADCVSIYTAVHTTLWRHSPSEAMSVLDGACLGLFLISILEYALLWVNDLDTVTSVKVSLNECLKQCSTSPVQANKHLSMARGLARHLERLLHIAEAAPHALEVLQWIAALSSRYLSMHTQKNGGTIPVEESLVALRDVVGVSFVFSCNTLCRYTAGDTGPYHTVACTRCVHTRTQSPSHIHCT
jgi:hypothetical protein